MSDMPEPWVPGTEAPDIGTAQGKLHAPATLRNRAAISAVLAEWLPGHGTVLEIASGSGEHVIHFASQMPHMRWQPSDPDAAAQRSIAAWTGEARLDNVDPPLMLDAAAADWPVLRADAVLCINMVHISPWAATEGLFTGTAALLGTGRAADPLRPICRGRCGDCRKQPRVRYLATLTRSALGPARCSGGCQIG